MATIGPSLSKSLCTASHALVCLTGGESYELQSIDCVVHNPALGNV